MSDSDPPEQAEEQQNPVENSLIAPVLTPEHGQKYHFKKWAIKSIKLVLMIVILASVARQIQLSWDKLPSFRPHFPLLILAGLLYIAGLVCFGIYYAIVVRLVAPQVTLIDCLKAYILSHPAKYVPGKAMVVVLRVGMLTKAGARSTAAMLSALYETLSMMAIGSLLGGLLLILPPSHPLASAVSICLGCAFLATILPMTFSRAAKLLKKGLQAIEPKDAPQPTRKITMGLIGWGCAGWLCWGLSQVAVVISLDNAGIIRLSYWPRVTGGVMLATAGGFALPVLPGGLGLREWILDEVTGELLGPDLAIAAALTLRFVWILAELVAAALVSLIPSEIAAAVPTPESDA